MGRVYYNHCNNEQNYFALSGFVVNKEHNYIYGVVTDLGTRDTCSVHWINQPDGISLKSAWWHRDDLIKIGSLNEMFLYSNSKIGSVIVN